MCGPEAQTPHDLTLAAEVREDGMLMSFDRSCQLLTCLFRGVVDDADARQQFSDNRPLALADGLPKFTANLLC